MQLGCRPDACPQLASAMCHQHLLLNQDHLCSQDRLPGHGAVLDVAEVPVRPGVSAQSAQQL